MAILNMVGGGGGSLQATDAILRVIAPAGSTVTISKGGVSKSDLGHENAADHTLYDYYFIIHASQFDSVNPWTVTATLGTQSISESVVIDAADEYDIVLNYTLWLIKTGESQAGDLIGLPLVATGISGEALAISYQSTYIQIGYSGTGTERVGVAYVNQLVDFSKYKTLHVDGTVRNNTDLALNCALCAWTSFGTYISDNRILQEQFSATLGTSYVSFAQDIDISSISNDAYIGARGYRSSSKYTSVRINNLYLEV